MVLTSALRGGTGYIWFPIAFICSKTSIFNIGNESYWSYSTKGIYILRGEFDTFGLTCNVRKRGKTGIYALFTSLDICVERNST